MQNNPYIASGRSMRWYEWLAGLFLLGLAFGVRAGSVYKCADGSGAIAFQDRPCAAAQAQSEVEIESGARACVTAAICRRNACTAREFSRIALATAARTRDRLRMPCQRRPRVLPPWRVSALVGDGRRRGARQKPQRQLGERFRSCDFA